MMVYCIAYGCKSNSKKNLPGLSFHRFPKDPKKRELWTSIIPVKKKISKTSALCSKHFKPSSFNRTYASGKIILRDEAVPVSDLESQSKVKEGGSAGTKCIACPNKLLQTRHDGQNIFYYRFPTEEHLQLQWKEMCGLGKDASLKSIRICSVHFKDEDFEGGVMPGSLGRKRELRQNAIPTLHLKPENSKIEKSKENKLEDNLFIPQKKIKHGSSEIIDCGENNEYDESLDSYNEEEIEIDVPVTEYDESSSESSGSCEEINVNLHEFSHSSDEEVKYEKEFLSKQLETMKMVVKNHENMLNLRRNALLTTYLDESEEDENDIIDKLIGSTEESDLDDDETLRKKRRTPKFRFMRRIRRPHTHKVTNSTNYTKNNSSKPKISKHVEIDFLNKECQNIQPTSPVPFLDRIEKKISQNEQIIENLGLSKPRDVQNMNFIKLGTYTSKCGKHFTIISGDLKNKSPVILLDGINSKDEAKISSSEENMIDKNCSIPDGSSSKQNELGTYRSKCGKHFTIISGDLKNKSPVILLDGTNSKDEAKISIDEGSMTDKNCSVSEGSSSKQNENVTIDSENVKTPSAMFDTVSSSDDEHIIQDSSNSSFWSVTEVHQYSPRDKELVASISDDEYDEQTSLNHSSNNISDTKYTATQRNPKQWIKSPADEHENFCENRLNQTINDSQYQYLDSELSEDIIIEGTLDEINAHSDSFNSNSLVSNKNYEVDPCCDHFKSIFDSKKIIDVSDIKDNETDTLRHDRWSRAMQHLAKHSIPFKTACFLSSNVLVLSNQDTSSLLNDDNCQLEEKDDEIEDFPTNDHCYSVEVQKMM